MDKTLKNIIAAAGTVAVLIFAYAAVSYVGSYGKSIQPSSFRSFSVTAQGVTTSIPDIAEFSFQVITQGGKDITATQAQNTTTVNKIIDFVKSQGVAAKDIKTLYYNVDPQYQTYNCYIEPMPLAAPAVNKSNSAASGPISSGSSSGSSGAIVPSQIKTCPPSTIVGYNITQSVDVKMRDFKKISDIMGGVVTNGANQVNSLSFTIDDPTSVQDAARAEAIAKAKVKAQAMAKAGGFKLGRLLNISDGGFTPYYFDQGVSAAVPASAGSAPTPPTIEPGSQETTVSVTMQYEIE